MAANTAAAEEPSHLPDASTPPQAAPQAAQQDVTAAGPAAEPPRSHAAGGAAPSELPPTGAAPAPLDTGTAVFAALRAQLASPQCHDDDRVVARWLDAYGRAPQRLAANLARILPLLAHVLEQLRDAGLPGEFALLPIVESWYRPDAQHAGAAGLWQFTAATARARGLQVDARTDQRYAPGASTGAAVRHLTELMQRFGDWRLAAMAYNAGAYRLQRVRVADPAMPSPQAHQPAGLSLVTYEHLAKLMALSCLVQEPERIGLVLPEHAFTPLTPQALLAMAPAAASPPAAGDGAVHEVQRGDSLWAIARRHGLAVADLLRWNGLDAASVLHPGQRLRLTP